MLRVTVELWPHGRADKKKTLAVMDIYNDGTGTDTRGNYKYRVYRRPVIGRPLSKPSREGAVTNYPRKAYPVWELVRRVLNGAWRAKK